MKKVRHIFTGCILFMLAFTAFGQTDNTIGALNRKSWQLAYSKPDSALYYARHARKLAIESNKKEDAIRSTLLMGIVYDVKAEYDSAMLFYHQALKTAEIQNDSVLQAASLSNIGLTFWHVGSYYKALEKFFAALHIYDMIKHGNTDIANVYNNIGLIYSELGEYRKSFGYFERAKKRYRRNADSLGLGAVMNNIAVHYRITGNAQKAKEVLDSSIIIKEMTGDYYGLAIAGNEKAEMFLVAGNYDEAYEILHWSLEYSKKINDLSAQAATYHLLQQVLTQHGRYSEALKYNRIAGEISRNIRDKKLLAENYKHLSEIYWHQDDYVNAYLTYKKYTSLKDSLIKQKQLSNIYELEFQHQIEDQRDEIQRLREKQKMQQLIMESQELKLTKRNLQLLLFALISGIILLFVYIRYLKSRSRHKREIVKTMMRQKTRQTENMFQAELKERKRISGELHDSLGQLMSLIKLNLSSVAESSKPGSKKLTQTLGLVDQAIVEIRNISRNLSPVRLKEKGLTHALKDMVQRVKSAGRINVVLATTEIDALDDEMIAYTIFTVIQELLNNAVRHAQCTSIELQAVYSGDDVTIMVEDNGKGFEESTVERGLGIDQIRSAVENLGGNVIFDSRPGRGTIVTIEIPTLKTFEI